MNHSRHHHRHVPVNFLIANLTINKDDQELRRKNRSKMIHFPKPCYSSYQKKTKEAKAGKKRFAVLPIAGNTLASHLYFQNSLDLKYSAYFHDQLKCLSTITKRCILTAKSVTTEQKLQLLQKQFTFLSLQVQRFKIDFINNHRTLSDAVANNSADLLDAVAKEEARIRSDVKVFLSRLEITKKGAIPLLKKLAGSVLQVEQSEPVDEQGYD